MGRLPGSGPSWRRDSLSGQGNTSREDRSALTCADDHATGPREEMGRLLRDLTLLAAARWRAGALAPALLLAGCFATKSATERAADDARVIALTQGLTVESVHCSPRGEAAWTCTGRLKSGREFTCSVGPFGRSAPTDSCTVKAPSP
jgi:hypothetical protein